MCPHCQRDLFPSRKPAPELAPVVVAPATTLAPAPYRAASATSSVSMILAGFVVAAALGCAALGALFLTQATVGVGLICGACFLGILARLLQAGAHHREIADALQQ